MKPYVRELRHDVYARRQRVDLRRSLKREVNIPKKIADFVINEDMVIAMWINKNKKLELSSTPFDFKKSNGIVLLRRILTNGHSYAFTIPFAVYVVLSQIYDIFPLNKVNFVVNARKNLELTPISDGSPNLKPISEMHLWLNRE
jgi:hypothetical protein